MIVYLRLTFVALTVRKSVMRALVTSFIQILLSFSSYFELALSLCVSMLIITTVHVNDKLQRCLHVSIFAYM